MNYTVRNEPTKICVNIPLSCCYCEIHKSNIWKLIQCKKKQKTRNTAYREIRYYHIETWIVHTQLNRDRFTTRVAKCPKEQKSPELPFYTGERCQLNSDAASTGGKGGRERGERGLFPECTAVFDLPPPKVTVCPIPLKVDERGNRRTEAEMANRIVREESDRVRRFKMR